MRALQRNDGKELSLHRPQQHQRQRTKKDENQMKSRKRAESQTQNPVWDEDRFWQEDAHSSAGLPREEAQSKHASQAKTSPFAAPPLHGESQGKREFRLREYTARFAEAVIG